MTKELQAAEKFWIIQAQAVHTPGQRVVKTGIKLSLNMAS